MERAGFMTCTSYWCRPEHAHSFVYDFGIDLARLKKYYVLTLESYNLNYNMFSNNGHFSQMKFLFTNKILMIAPLGSSG